MICIRRVFVIVPCLLLAAVAHADDLLVATASGAVLDALAAAIDLKPVEGERGARVFSGRIPRATGDALSVRVAAFPRLDAAARDVAAELVREQEPRYVALLETGMSLVASDAIGTVYTARSIWDFRVDGDDVSVDRAAQFRCDLGIVSAAMTTALAAGAVRGFATGNGALAAGPRRDGDPDWAAELLALNERTRVQVPGAAEIAEAVDQARAQGIVVGLAALVGVAAGSGAQPADDALAARNAVALLVDLTTNAWPTTARRALWP